MLDSIKKTNPYGITEFPERYIKFYETEISTYISSNYKLEEAPYYFGEGIEAWLDFSEKEVNYLMKTHLDMLTSCAEGDDRKYIPLAGIDDTIDFLVVDVSDEKCPVYYGDCEDGEIKKQDKSLDDFLKYTIEKEE